MKSFVRFMLVSIFLVALTFFCKGLWISYLSESDTAISIQTSTGRLTDTTQSNHLFIKFNTPCLSSPTAEGQTVVRTVTGASGSTCRQLRRTEFEFRLFELKTFCHPICLRRSLPTLRKLRL